MEQEMKEVREVSTWDSQKFHELVQVIRDKASYAWLFYSNTQNMNISSRRKWCLSLFHWGFSKKLLWRLDDKSKENLFNWSADMFDVHLFQCLSKMGENWKTKGSLTENMMVTINISQNISSHTHNLFDWLTLTCRRVIKKTPSSDKNLMIALNSLSFLFLSGMQIVSREIPPEGGHDWPCPLPDTSDLRSMASRECQTTGPIAQPVDCHCLRDWESFCLVPHKLIRDTFIRQPQLHSFH